MNSKTLKVAGAVVLSCLVMIVIVISTPKPEPRRTKRRLPSKVIGTEYLRLANQALSKTNKANRITHQKLRQFTDGEKIIDFSPLTAANIVAINALAEADKSIKLCNEELQNVNKEEASLTILIEANIKLIASLNEISEIVKGLNIEVQHLEKENAQPLALFIEKVVDVLTKLINAIEKGTKALDETISAYREYYQLDQL